ncbi:PIN domain-containing protein [Deinococcus sp.]|uniref:type II toxin-antitoxin system VapC family toxin n=1 Tax=Deinococcus sp. TaxID=47478 RepID=UPI00286E4D80|nr:PIN domain-containing protein [Deinococcus sp.]
MTTGRVLVDSDVWSEFYRKRVGDPSEQVRQLRALIVGRQVLVIGAIRQEVLTGWRYPHQFEQVREQMRAFPNEVLTEREYELAAEFSNTCRSKGVQGSHTDFLICACSAAWDVPVLTRDQDYLRYAEHVPVRLYAP